MCTQLFTLIRNHKALARVPFQERIYSAWLAFSRLPGCKRGRDLRELSAYKPHGIYVCTHMCVWRQMSCLVIFYAGRSQAPTRSRNIALSATTSLFFLSSLSLSFPYLSYRSCSFSHSSSFARRDIGTEYRVSIAATIIEQVHTRSAIDVPMSK